MPEKVKVRDPVQKRKYKMPVSLMKKKRVEKIRRDLKKPTRNYIELRNEERAAWNVAERSEKVGYDPKIDMNWCHLPTEIRLKCIEPMDLVTRIHLGACSKSEKSLTESKTYRLDDVTFKNYSNTITVIGLNEKRNDVISSEEKSSNDAKLQLEVYLLQKCEYEKLTFKGFYFYGRESREIDYLRRLVPFRCREFEAYGNNETSVLFILSNCTRLETITFDQESVFDKLALFLPVVNVNELRLWSYSNSAGVSYLVEKWIEIDAEVGKSIQYMSSSLSNVEDFASEFSDRVVTSEEHRVTIKMNNKHKEILLTSYGTRELENDYISIEVISTTPPYSRRYCEKWIEKRCREEKDAKREERRERGW